MTFRHGVHEIITDVCVIARKLAEHINMELPT